MRPYLLDANVEIALAIAEHEFHDAASRWISGVDSFALCPITEGAPTRFVARAGERAHTAQQLLTGMDSHPGAQFRGDDLSGRHVNLDHVLGHRQVTDAYLIALARHRGGRLATFQLINHDGALPARGLQS